jgi:hypothetical protein
LIPIDHETPSPPTTATMFWPLSRRSARSIKADRPLLGASKPIPRLDLCELKAAFRSRSVRRLVVTALLARKPLFDQPSNTAADQETQETDVIL